MPGKAVDSTGVRLRPRQGRRQKKAGDTKNVVSVCVITRGEWLFGALGRKVRTEKVKQKGGQRTRAHH